MHNTRRRALLSALKLFDVSMMCAAFLVAACVVLGEGKFANITELFSARIRIHNFVIFSAFVYLWHLVFSLSGIYNSRRLSNRKLEIRDIVAAASIATLVMIGGGMLFKIRLMTPLFIGLFWAQSTLGTVAARLALRGLLGFVRKRGRNLQQLVIVGTNDRAISFAETLLTRPELGCRVAGFVDHQWPGITAFEKRGYALSSGFDDFRTFLRKSVVDEVVIALPFRSMHDQASAVAACCEEQGVKVRFLADMFGLKRSAPHSEDLEGQVVFTHPGLEAMSGSILLKRAIDLLVSIVVLTAFSPLLVLVAALLKLTSPGPVLFVQKRVGLNKRPFSVYKFRTMISDAEQRLHDIEHLNEVSGPVFKIKHDPRITPLGRLLRKTSFDELPQLINVIKGEMSLVGPRPLPLRDYEGFNEDWQRRRFSVRPGITCLWQVLGRSSIPFEKWMELDVQYIDRWSLWLDLKILLQTIPAVLKGSGAA